MENYSNVTSTILETINTILGNLFSSIDNNIYTVLDDITFISSDIIYESYFEKILGTSASSGILLITNSLIFGFVLYYSIKYLLAHFTYKPTESPKQFIFKAQNVFINHNNNLQRYTLILAVEVYNSF
jgi:hypothetical protein